MTIFSVRHVTTYDYRRPVRFGEHHLMFRPRDSYDQRLLRSQFAVDPAPSGVRWIHDVFGNCVALVRISRPAARLRFETSILLDHTPQAAPDLQIDSDALTYPFEYGPDEAADLAPCMRPHYPDDAVVRWARRFLHPGGATETGHLLDDALLRHPRGLRLFAPVRSPARSRPRSRSSAVAAAAATSRC